MTRTAAPITARTVPTARTSRARAPASYVTTRSWLDAGTEVLPGDRKFMDYAFPSPYGYPTFARENNNRPIDRQPLNPPSDMGGYPDPDPAAVLIAAIA